MYHSNNSSIIIIVVVSQPALALLLKRQCLSSNLYIVQLAIIILKAQCFRLSPTSAATYETNNIVVIA